MIVAIKIQNPPNENDDFIPKNKDGKIRKIFSFRNKYGHLGS